MNKKLIGFCLAASASLTACGPIYNVSYQYKPPHRNKARRCIVACQRNKLMCQRNASQQYDRCEDRALRSAQASYHAYRVNQRRSHQPVKRNLDDFKYDWGCSSGNNCDADYRQCYVTCGGTVITHRTCVAFCDKDGAKKH